MLTTININHIETSALIFPPSLFRAWLKDNVQHDLELSNSHAVKVHANKLLIECM